MREKFHEGIDIPKRDLEQKWREKDKTKRILVIDDEPLLIDLLTNLLTLLGYRVDSALNSREASGKLKDQKYDLIFLDMKMPLMDGKRFYMKIKEYIPTLAKRIVFLTGDVGNKETIDFISETQNLYLGKPFTIKEVRDLLSRFFNSCGKP
jgi:CheY-like chemotaxis protein